VIVTWPHVPLYLLLALALALSVAYHLIGGMVFRNHPRRALAGAAVFAALLVVSMVARASAPRTATQPAPIPEGTGYENGGRRLATPSVVESRSPAPSADGFQPSPSSVPSETRLGDDGDAPDRSQSLRGTASWVRASLGPSYLAMRLPRGTLVRICGPLDCVRRTVNDYGPSKRKHPDRVADLSARDFQRTCGPLTMGLCVVRVWVLGGIGLPETSTP
jgi:hypothetical protein